MIGFLPSLAFGQGQGADSTMTHKEKRQQFHNYLFVNLNIGGMQQNTDVVINKYLSPLYNWRLGYGGGFGWQIHPIWGVRAGITFGDLFGESKENVFWMTNVDPVYKNGVYFRAKLYEYRLDATVNFSNLISGYNPDRFFDVYGIAGFGFTEWNTQGYYYTDDGASVQRWEDGQRTDPDGQIVDAYFHDYRGYHDGFSGKNRKSDLNLGLGGAFHIIPQ